MGRAAGLVERVGRSSGGVKTPSGSASRGNRLIGRAQGRGFGVASGAWTRVRRANAGDGEVPTS